jgi:phage gp36-like protein
MPQNIDVNQLNQAKANVTLTQTLLSQAIEKSSSDPTLAQEALKQAANEISSALTAVNQVQGTSNTKKSQ